MQAMINLIILKVNQQIDIRNVFQDLLNQKERKIRPKVHLVKKDQEERILIYKRIRKKLEQKIGLEHMNSLKKAKEKINLKVKCCLVNKFKRKDQNTNSQLKIMNKIEMKFKNYNPSYYQFVLHWLLQAKPLYQFVLDWLILKFL